VTRFALNATDSKLETMETRPPHLALIRDTPAEPPLPGPAIQELTQRLRDKSWDAFSPESVSWRQKAVSAASIVGHYAKRPPVMVGIAAVAVLIVVWAVWGTVAGRDAGSPAAIGASATTATESRPNPTELAAATARRNPSDVPLSRPGAPSQTRQRLSARQVVDVPAASQATSDEALPSAPTATAPIVPAVGLDIAPSLAASPTETAVHVEDRIYSSVDLDVIPPRLLVAPDTPVPLISGLPTRPQAVEVVVNEDGHVGHVQLKTPSYRMRDVMMLSRAKMWRFEPARRDGRPVAYRVVILWDTTDY
jgi:hypothetical protein